MTAFSDPDLLMRAILEAPEDDAPRLVFADCLDEHGEGDHASFIRVQCELARDWHHPCLKGGLNPGHPRDCRGCTLRRRERELWNRIGVGLFNDLGVAFPDHSTKHSLTTETGFALVRIGGGTSTAMWRRGFIDSVSLPLAAFLRIAAGLAAQPVTKVVLTDREPFGSVAGPDGLVWWYVGPDMMRPGSDEPIRHAHHLPTDLDGLLKSWLPVTRRMVGGQDLHLEHCRGYPTADAAHSALALAAANHVRSLAPTTHRAPCPRCKGTQEVSRYPVRYRTSIVTGARRVSSHCPDCDGGWVTRPGLVPLVAG